MYSEQVENNFKVCEIGPAETAAADFIESTLAVHRQGADYVWTGTHYQMVEDLSVKVRQFLLKRQIKQTTTFVNNVVAIVRAMHYLDPLKYPDVPCWTGGADGPANALIFKNCICDLDTGATLDHSRNFFSPYILPYEYDPGAECPQWLAFLEDAFEGDQERVGLLQEWFGYVLSGDTSQQKYMNAYGVKNSGKGTTADVLAALIGVENSTGFDLRQLAGRFGASSLVCKKLALVEEVELSGCKEKAAIVEKLKAITGEGLTEIEYKGDNVRPSIKLPTRFHVSSNTLPELKDPSGALGRRLLVLPFFVGKTDEQRDTTLKGRLRTELSGICNWSLKGLRRLRDQKKFTVPTVCRDVMSAYETDTSPALGFLRECCVVSKSVHPGNLEGIEVCDGNVSTDRADFYRAASWWYDDQNKGFNNVWFARDVRACLPKANFDKKVGGNRHVAGVRLRPGVRCK